MSVTGAACSRGQPPLRSGSTRLSVGGTQPSCIALIVATAPMPPAAPSVWPMAPFVAVMLTLGAWSPKIVRKPVSSAGSPSGVDVAWALMWSMSVGSMSGLGQGAPRGADAALPARRGQRDVHRVGGRAVAAQLGEDADAALARVVELLQHEHRGALGDHEAVTTLVERPARAFGIVVAPRQRAHRVESSDQRLVDGCLGAAGEHHVGVVADDHLGGLADGMPGGGTGADSGEVGAARAEADRRLAGRHVGDAHRDEERRHPVRATRGVDRDLLDERARAAQARADDGAGAIGKLTLEPLRAGRPGAIASRVATRANCV